MRAVVVGKPFGRREKGRLVSHPPGSEIDVSDRTLAAFPHRFRPVAGGAEVPAEPEARDEKAALIEMAEASGVEIDKRWSTERIRAAVYGVGSDADDG